MPEYTKKQLWKLYEKLPSTLKEAIFSQDTADDIYHICERYDVLDKVSEMAKYVGRILLGLLPPDEFQGVLENELKIEKEKAKKINHEIHRFILFSVSGDLEKIYQKEVKPTPFDTQTSSEKKEVPETTLSEYKDKESKGDKYREPIE